MSNLELLLQKINDGLKGCLSNQVQDVILSISTCLEGFRSIIMGTDSILKFNHLETLEVVIHHSKSIKECQLLASKKLLAFVEILLSFLTNQHSLKTKKAALNTLLELSRLHLLSSPDNCRENLLMLINESILQGLFKNIIEGNDLEIAQLFSKIINNHADIGILMFYYYAEIIQNEKFLQNAPEQKIDAIWILLRSLDDNSISSKDLFYGSHIKSIKKKGINDKRSNPYVPETQDEQISEIETFEKLYKNTFQKLSQNFLKTSSLKDERIEEFLKIFTKKIIPRLENPLLFVDYLMFHFERGSNADIQILALSCIFTLIIKNALDLPNYYNKLYSILSKHLAAPNDSFLFKSKYKHKFLKLLDSSLRSSKLPVNLIASYIKILARVAMRTEASETLWICSLLHNLLKRNDTLLNMVRSANFKAKTVDTFNFLEKDVLQTSALENALWELKTLKNHYCKEVRDLVDLFPNLEKNQALKTDDFMDIQLENLVLANLEKAQDLTNVSFVYQVEDESSFQFLKGTTFGNFLG